VYLHFYPSAEVIYKLLIKAAQCKDAVGDFWQGFHAVDRGEGHATYHPKMIIKAFDFEKNEDIEID
jgi:hypothetical protein